MKYDSKQIIILIIVCALLFTPLGMYLHQDYMNMKEDEISKELVCYDFEVELVDGKSVQIGDWRFVPNGNVTLKEICEWTSQKESSGKVEG